MVIKKKLSERTNCRSKDGYGPAKAPSVGERLGKVKYRRSGVRERDERETRKRRADDEKETSRRREVASSSNNR